MQDKAKLLEQFLENNPQLAESLEQKFSLYLNDYIPHTPLPKQWVFLQLPHLEALYGGAGGGGKSEALLMAALQYVHIRGYSAILFRRRLTDLCLEQSLMPRSFEWLSNTDAVWCGRMYQWRFPSGAVLQFGYLDSTADKYRYASSEYQFIGFDELTQFTQDEYEFLFTRLRKRQCPKHSSSKDSRNCKTCREVAAVSQVPLRMRSATNPGGVGHRWVKERFRIQPVTLPDGRVVHRGTHPERAFIPASVYDNPYLDKEGYIESLRQVDPILRAQILHGDWTVTADVKFRPEWLRRYIQQPDNPNCFVLSPDDQVRRVYRSECRLFQTIDPAASQREGPGDTTIGRRSPSFTVISTWLVTPQYDLLLLDAIRLRKEIPETLEAIKAAAAKHKPEFIGIESSGLGIGVYQFVERSGLPVRQLKPKSADKVVRSTDAANRMQQGKIFFPPPGTFTDQEACEDELFSWTGHPQQSCDFVDTLSYAAIIVSELSISGSATVEVPRIEKITPAVFSPIIRRFDYVL